MEEQNAYFSVKNAPEMLTGPFILEFFSSSVKNVMRTPYDVPI